MPKQFIFAFFICCFYTAYTQHLKVIGCIKKPYLLYFMVSNSDTIAHSFPDPYLRASISQKRQKRKLSSQIHINIISEEYVYSNNKILYLDFRDSTFNQRILASLPASASIDGKLRGVVLMPNDMQSFSIKLPSKHIYCSKKKRYTKVKILTDFHLYEVTILNQIKCR